MMTSELDGTITQHLPISGDRQVFSRSGDVLETRQPGHTSVTGLQV